jgi:hypothetical protein
MSRGMGQDTTTTDTAAIVDAAARQILARSEAQAWAVCACIWARLWVLAGPGWVRWPDAQRRVLEALTLALAQCVGVPSPSGSSAELVLIGLEGLAVEDDGSPEWGFMLDLVEDLLAVLHGEPVQRCIATTLRTFLEGMFNLLANQLAASAGGTISHTEANKRLAHNDAWKQTVAFVQSL